MDLGDSDDGGMGDAANRLERWGNKLISNLDAWLDGLAEMIRQRLEDLTNEVFPGGTGKTAAAWTVISLGLGDFYITNSNEPTISYLTQGTAAHWVFPTVAAALSWVDEGGVRRFSKGHMVSGIIGVDLEGIVMQEMDPYIEAGLDAAIDAADREAGFE